MLILGAASIIQIIFLPGFIFLKYLGFTDKIEHGESCPVRLGVYAFGLSLLINYIAVCFFVFLGIYRPPTLYILFALEILLLVTASWKKRPARFSLGIDIPKITGSARKFFASHSTTYNVLFILTLLVIAFYAWIFLSFLGSSFWRWDPVTNWNRFAVDWAGDHWPVHTWRYPQLVPVNWSLSYVFMNDTHVDLFAKAIMPLFALGILLLFLDLGIKKKRGVYFMGAIFYGFILKFQYSAAFIASGHMDIPVSFFAFLAFHVMHAHGEKGGERSFKVLWLAVLTASAAAVTKQAGLYILVFILIWAAMELIKGRRKSTGTALAARLLVLLLITLVVAGSWYIIKDLQFIHGRDIPETMMLQKAHHNRTFLQRFGHGIEQIFPRKVLTPLQAGIFLLVLAGLFHKKSRPVSLFIVIPYALIWGFFYSYDDRNIAFAFPFAAFAAAWGVSALKKRLAIPLGRLKLNIPLVPVLAALILAAAGLNTTILSKEALKLHQDKYKLRIGLQPLNELLIQYHRTVGISGKIASHYRPLKYIPILEKYYRRINWCCRNAVSIKFFKYLDSKKASDIHYFLMRAKELEDRTVFDHYWHNIKAGKYHLIFKAEGYIFVKIR